MPSKTVGDSAVHEHIYKIFPNDLNSHKTMFGGRIMATIDRIALVVAERHSGEVCVTASVDAVHFMAPAREGDTLIYSASVNRAWNSSMEIGARVMAENSYTGERRHVVSAYLTFVALDKANRPTGVPALSPQTELEKNRFEEAGIRRKARLAQANELKTLRANR